MLDEAQNLTKRCLDIFRIDDMRDVEIQIDFDSDSDGWWHVKICERVHPKGKLTERCSGSK